MVEHIADQGARIGEAELTAYILVLESSTYRRFGAWAVVVRKYARIAWRETGEHRTHVTTLAKGH
jgi:hypothetical protein